MFSEHLPVEEILWRKESYPNPFDDQQECRSSSTRFCDPDNFFRFSGKRQIEQRLIKERRAYTVIDNNMPFENVNVTVSVALMRKVVSHNTI